VETLKQQIHGKISSFATPSRWVVQREPLVTNHTGKVDKMAISARFKSEMDSAKEGARS